jgi:hypothetical protein
MQHTTEHINKNKNLTKININKLLNNIIEMCQKTWVIKLSDFTCIHEVFIKRYTI